VFIVGLTTSGPGLATVGTTDFLPNYEKLQNLQTPKTLTLIISKTVEAIPFSFGRLVAFAKANKFV
jgi:hypothetical protein